MKFVFGLAARYEDDATLGLSRIVARRGASSSATVYKLLRKKKLFSNKKQFQRGKAQKLCNSDK
jgi:hypothetical protein